RCARRCRKPPWRKLAVIRGMKRHGSSGEPPSCSQPKKVRGTKPNVWTSPSSCREPRLSSKRKTTALMAMSSQVITGTVLERGLSRRGITCQSFLIPAAHGLHGLRFWWGPPPDEPDRRSSQRPRFRRRGGAQGVRARPARQAAGEHRVQGDTEDAGHLPERQAVPGGGAGGPDRRGGRAGVR